MEYISGLVRDPKYGHIKDLHASLKLAKKALLWATPSFQALGEFLEVIN